MVAQVRGIVYRPSPYNSDVLVGDDSSRLGTETRALRDVQRWLGFNANTDEDANGVSYCEALKKERSAIFKRAKRSKNRREPKASRP